MMQYNILCTVKRFEAYETIGGLFTEVTNDTLELSVTDKIWAIILDFVLEAAERYSDFIESNPVAHTLHNMYIYKQASWYIFTCESSDNNLSLDLGAAYSISKLRHTLFLNAQYSMSRAKYDYYTVAVQGLANDNMDHIDKNTLKAVGQTVLEVIYNEK